MTINIQYVHLDVSETLNEYLEDKLKRLGKKFPWVIGAEVHFKIDPRDLDNGKICNIELSLPGPRIFATSNEKNYEMAIKNTIKDLEVQLKKRKQVFKVY